MRVVAFLGGGAVGSLLLVAAASGDMGAIVPVGEVRLDEPGQKAIIAHDGFEEILILGTDLQASSSAKVLRFIPLPAEPAVTLAPQDCFTNLAKLLRKHDLRYLVRYRGGQSQAEDSVEVRLQERLGAHDVTVVRVRDSKHFADWANEFFKRKGLPQRELTSEEAELVSDYVDRGMPFFVFDLVELGPETRSVDPLVYRFPVRHLYYPLKTSNLFAGEIRIELFIFSDRGGLAPRSGWRDQSFAYPGQPADQQKPHRLPYFLDSTTAIVTGEEMKAVCPAIAELLGNRAVLHAFKLEGKPSFEDDVWSPIQVHEATPSYRRPPP
jgi:hypothetical protein